MILHKKRYSHGMIDLETLSLKNDAVIIQVAFVPFDIETGQHAKHVFCRQVDPADCERYGLRMSDETVAWWQNQDPAVKESVLQDQEPLDFVLDMLSSHIINYTLPDARIWSHSTFDIPVLNTAYERVGREVPWHYKHTCDIRTLEWLAGNPEIEIQNKQAHNALSDCLAQIEYVHKLYMRIKEGNGTFKI